MPQREGVIQTHAETSQETVWQGDFGRAYTDRNTLDPESLDELSLRNYGIARSTIVRRFLEEEVPKDARRALPGPVKAMNATWSLSIEELFYLLEMIKEELLPYGAGKPRP